MLPIFGAIFFLLLLNFAGYVRCINGIYPYPPNSNMGFFVAIAVPLEDPYSTVSMSYFFEANYVLPNKTALARSPTTTTTTSTTTTPLTTSSTTTTMTPSTESDSMTMTTTATPSTDTTSSPTGKSTTTRRSIDRSTVYTVIRNKLDRAGFPGHDCLLRSICETSEQPLDHNGIVGDVMTVIFTPSTSRPEDDLPEGVREAEAAGRSGSPASCDKYKLRCPIGLFDLVSKLI
ncbi:chitinase 3 [Trichogramma pretiosum]|uniref:chitinase 3 n=1 Tax=Trichogramma pretiosum TaxID=7493 RepID=UPI000C7189F3|nr:chitinase 3 [Trichogramma pretiosum]